jgi:hypothetical protein
MINPEEPDLSTLNLYNPTAVAMREWLEWKMLTLAIHNTTAPLDPIQTERMRGSYTALQEAHQLLVPVPQDEDEAQETQ